MSRPASTTKILAEDIKLLQQFGGGPFIMRIQRRDPISGKTISLGLWESITMVELTGDIEQQLFNYAGGGDYVLSVYSADDRVHPKHSFPLTVPGDPRTPTTFGGTATGLPTAAPPTTSWPYGGGWTGGWGGWGGGPGGGMGGVGGMSSNPWWWMMNPHAAGGGGAQASTKADGWEEMLRYRMASDADAERARRERMVEWEEMERRERLRRQGEREERQVERQNMQGGSPEIDALKEMVRALEGKLADERREGERRETERRQRESEREAVLARKEADDRHLREMEALRREQTEAKREVEARFEKLLLELKDSKTVSQPNFTDELRRLEERFKTDQDRQREADERRRIEETARHQADTLRQELTEARRTADQKFLELAGKKDDTGMLTALGAIFGKTLEGSQASSQNVLQALTAIMQSQKNANELPEWMRIMLEKQTGRGEEMGQIAAASGQILSVALGAVGQALQHIAAMQPTESPWMRVAESLFSEVGTIGAALINRGLGPQGGPGEPLPANGQPKQVGAPAQPKVRPARPVAPEVEVEARTVKSAGAETEPTPPSEVIPDDKTNVGEAQPASSSEMVATRMRQLKKAIRRGMSAAQAARALIEVTQFEAAYSGKLPAPLDRLETEPRVVVAGLFEEWLKNFGDNGVEFLKTMQDWVEKFLKEGLPEDNADEDKGASGAGEGDDDQDDEDEEEEEGEEQAAAAPQPAAETPSTEPPAVAVAASASVVAPPYATALAVVPANGAGSSTEAPPSEVPVPPTV